VYDLIKLFVNAIIFPVLMHFKLKHGFPWKNKTKKKHIFEDIAWWAYIWWFYI